MLCRSPGQDRAHAPETCRGLVILATKANPAPANVQRRRPPPHAQNSPQRAAITPTRSNHPNAQQSTVAGDQLRIENVAGKVSSSPPLVKSMPCKVHDDPTGTVVGTVKFK